MKINKNLKNQIQDRTFNLSFHPVFSHNPERLMNIGFDKSTELLRRRVGRDNIGPRNLFMLYQTYNSKICVLESEITGELETIAEDTIRELYNVPDGINIKPKIVDQDDIDYDFESQDEKRNTQLSTERLKIIEEEANKRIILNSIVNGSSVMIWSSAYYIAKEKLDKLNTKLVEAYDIYSAVVGLLWLQEPDQDMSDVIKQGICEINFDDGLKCEGINFPVLLLETNKVVFDYLICKGIPEDFSEEELELYYAISDDYNHEIWHNLLSPIIYEDFLETIDTESHNLPKIISKLSQLEYEKLKEIFILIQSNKEEAKTKMKIYGII